MFRKRRVDKIITTRCGYKTVLTSKQTVGKIDGNEVTWIEQG